MRVLLVSPSMHPSYGGPPRTVAGTALALARAGVGVEIATTGNPAQEAETRASLPQLTAAGIILHIFPVRFPRAMGRSSAITRFARENAHRYDLVHVHCLWENALATSAAAFRVQGKPTVISCHGMLDRWQMRQSVLKKMLARHVFQTGAMLQEASGLVFGSRDELEEASVQGFSAPAMVVPNGVEPGESDGTLAGRQSMLARFGDLASWSRTVLFFSRMHPKKGIDLLVEAFARVHRDFPGTGLLVAAIRQDADYEAAVRARIDALGPLPIRLVCEANGLGPTEAFAVADLFCLPSHQEGFSMAILEAASAGLPLLITDKCHFPEIEVAGAGLVVPDTVEGLEQGLRNLLGAGDAALAGMGERARALVAEHYTWDRIAAQLVSTYAQVLAP